MPDPDDKLTDIPRIVPQRDDYSRVRADAGESRRNTRVTKSVATEPQARVSGLLRFCAFMGFLVSVAASAAAGWLYMQNQQLNTALEQSNLRISDLEGRLSTTDDSVNQSSATMQVKIKELASEVDKLWASAWRKNRDRLDALEAGQKKAGDTTGKQLATLKANLSNMDQKLAVTQDLSISLATMKEQQGSQQAAITRLGSTVNTLSNTQRAQEARLKETEQWVQSNIEFRKQVTQRLSRLENPGAAAE